MAIILQAQSVTKRFGSVHALDQLSLSVHAGEIYCLLGANGAGKTTLVNLFLGFTQADGGQLHVAGVDVRTDPIASKRLLGYIPEQVNLYGNLTGLENLRYFAGLALGHHPADAGLMGWLTDAGLDAGAAMRRVSTYSKGMRQKVGIAIALAKQAPALLLDEPTSGLDPKAAAEFAEGLRAARDRGAAVLTTTHDLFHALHTGNRIGIMRAGRLVAEHLASDLDVTRLEALYLEHMQ